MVSIYYVFSKLGISEDIVVRSILAVTCIAIVAGASHGSALAGDASNYDRCRDGDEEAAYRISACSQIINNPKMPEDLRAEAYNNRGDAYANATDYNAAIADHSLALKLRPDYAEAYNLRAWAYFKAGKPREGLTDAEKAVSLQPDSAYSLDTRAHIYEALGMKEKAVEDYRRALSLEPDLQESKDGLISADVKP
jgi:tetratricopeptide (TPR) repeat protein